MIKSTVITVLASILLFVSCRKPVNPGVIMIGFDGVSIDVIDDMAGRGELPGFRKLMDEGATLKVKSFGKMLSPVIWTTVITGKTPDKHGISDFITRESPKGKMSFSVYSYNRKAKALWNLVPDNGSRAAVVNWWGTYPCEKIDGTIVSKQFIESYVPKKIYSELSVYPEDYSRTCMEISEGVISEYDEKKLELGLKYPSEHSIHYYKDQSVFEIFKNLYDNDSSYGFLAAYFWELDQIQHIYYYAYDREYDQELIPKRGIKVRDNFDEHIITDYYRYYDLILQEIISMMDDNTVLFVVSDHGFGMVETGIPWHLDTTYGFCYSSGKYIKKGVSVPGIEMTDFVPTILYILGFPVAEDMDGKVITEILNKDFFNREIKYVESYDRGFAVERPDHVNPVEEDQIERLRTLGYIN